MCLTLPTPFAALIFDCDGTLIDTAPAHFSAVAQALAAQGHTMDRAWYMARTGLTPDALLDEHEGRLAAEAAAGHNEGRSTASIPALDRAAVFASYDRLYFASLPLVQEVKLIADLARTWHDRVPTAVASNGRRANVAASLRAVGLLPLFDHIVAAEDVARGKPAPDVFLEAARRMSVEPSGCIVLEDSAEGLAAAAAAGMRAIDVRPSLPPSA